MKGLAPLPFTNEVRLITRIADLDSQRHVTSRTYESFCLESRYQLINSRGFNIAGLLENNIQIIPKLSFARFKSQQYNGAELQVKTEAYPMKDGTIFWDHDVLQSDGIDVCKIQLVTQATKEGQYFNLLSNEDVFEMPTQNKFLEIMPFSDKCKRVQSEVISSYSDRNITGDYWTSALWKIFEDTRWMFVEKLDLTYEKFVEFDTILFFMGGNFIFHKQPKPGRKLIVYTWMEKFEKIRWYMRQEVVDPQTDEILLSAREEHLVVSLSKGRPRKAPQGYIDLVKDYVENQE